MKTTMKLVAVIFCVGIAAPLSAQQTDVLFKNDVKQYITAGDKTKDVPVTLTIGLESLTVTRGASDVSVIPFSAITGATYDRRGRQRKVVGLPLTVAGVTPKLQHFLTVKFKTETSGDFVELELGKDIANRVVATLEAKSGKSVDKVGV